VNRTSLRHPPERIIGSSGKTKFEERDGKALGIEWVIGRRSILAIRNSDGDFQMLEWATGFWVCIHHDRAANTASRKIAFRAP